MNTCGFWAHCAHHCDLPCDHDEWCPDYPAPLPEVVEHKAPPVIRRALSTLRRWLLTDPATWWANVTAGEDER